MPDNNNIFSTSSAKITNLGFCCIQTDDQDGKA